MSATDISHGLAGRVAIVTGGNHGIGAATALALAAHGVAVLVTYLRLIDEPDPGTPAAYRQNRARDAQSVLATIRDRGGSAVAVEADLADPTTPQLLFDTAERELGPVDILINNASAWLADSFAPHATDRHGRTLQPVTAASFDRQFAVDARATALMIAEFARRSVAQDRRWGRIISLTSNHGNGFPEEVSYGAAKSALVDYTLAAAHELAPYGITANAVHPPVTDTGWVSPQVRAAVTSDPRLRRVASPEEVAEAIVLLVGEDARLITGNVINLH